MKKIILILTLLFSSVFAVDLDTKIGQMILIGFNGDNVDSSEFQKVLEQSKNGKITGVILFRKNIKSKNDLIKMNEELIKNSPIAPFISIDNEGGYVQRYDFIEHKSPKDVSKLSAYEAKKEYSLMATLLKELKINLNFAPCVDLEINKNSIISTKKRSYGDKPEIVTKYSKIFIQEHNKKNIATSIKHFPGHGSVEGDTHLGFVDATKTFKSQELKPYFDLRMLDKLNMVMVSHIFNSNLDKKYPASLSEKTIKDFLIDEIGFNGVIISDDYDMGAIRKNYSLREIVVNSINSGINILMFSNNIEVNDDDIVPKIKKIIKEEIAMGNINIQDINSSYNKIIKLKRNLK